MSFAAEFGLEVEGVCAVEIYVVILRGCQVCDGRVGDGVAVGAQSVERVAEVGGGPEHRGIGDEGEAQRLVDLVIEVPSPDVALMGEERSRRRACRLSPLFSWRRTPRRSSSSATYLQR